MKKIVLYTMISAFVLFLAGCAYDNYDAPTSSLSGNIVYNNVPIGVRSGATTLELWQYKWDTQGLVARAKITVNISQDGFYSARLFDGDYKLVRVQGGPWSNLNTDTISVTVSGKTILDVPVTPLYILSTPTITNSSGVITSSVSVTKVGTTNITSLTLYVGATNIVDANNKLQEQVIAASGLTDLTTPKTNTITLSAANAERNFVFARLGVLAVGSSERYYTPVQKIVLH